MHIRRIREYLKDLRVEEEALNDIRSRRKSSPSVVVRVVATLGHAIIRNFSTGTTQQDPLRVHFSDESQVESPIVEAEMKLVNSSFVVTVDDEAGQSSNENRTGGTPRETTSNRSQYPHRANPIRGQAQPNVR